MSQYEENEFQGILVNSDFKVTTKQTKKKATIETGMEAVEIDEVLDILQKSGIIAKTENGKYCITKKARQKQLKGFKIAHK